MMANGNPVSKVEAISLARKYNMEYFETSARLNIVLEIYLQVN